MTLTDLERRDASGPVFPADVHTYTRTVSSAAIECGMVTHVGCVCKESGMPHLKRHGGLQRYPILVPP